MVVKPGDNLYQKRRTRLDRLGEDLTLWLMRAVAGAFVLGVGALCVNLLWQALPALQTFGFSFFVSSRWDPVSQNYGILAQLIGTLVSSAVALLIAIPIGLGAAMFLSEDLLSERFRRIASVSLELLAAVPSVVYGIFGLLVLLPALRTPLNFLHEYLGWVPFFSTPLVGPAVLPAAIILAVMVLPTIAALCRDALTSQPIELRQAAYALGATRWETVLQVLLPASSRGVAAACMLALARATGETMAVAMLIGNANVVSWSLLSPGTTVASQIANQFGEATGLQLSALMLSALSLLVIGVIINTLAGKLIRPAQGGKR